MFEIKKMYISLLHFVFFIYNISCYYYNTRKLKISHILLAFLYLLCRKSKKDELVSHMHKVSAITPPKQILHSVAEYMKNTRNALRGELVRNKNIVNTIITFKFDR